MLWAHYVYSLWSGVCVHALAREVTFRHDSPPSSAPNSLLSSSTLTLLAITITNYQLVIIHTLSSAIPQLLLSASFSVSLKLLFSRAKPSTSMLPSPLPRSPTVVVLVVERDIAPLSPPLFPSFHLASWWICHVLWSKRR